MFFAIPLSEEIKAALSAYQADLVSAGVTGRFSPAEDLHITLAFIGEYPDPDKAIAAAEGLSFDSFTLEIQDTGFFSDTLWAGISGNGSLDRLAGRLRRALSDSGIPCDRKRFRPHITLARRVTLPDRMRRLPFPVHASMTADSFSLFRSDRGKRGMIYTEIASFSSEDPEL